MEKQFICISSSEKVDMAFFFAISAEIHSRLCEWLLASFARSLP